MKIDKLQNYPALSRDYSQARAMTNTARTVNYSSTPAFTGGWKNFADKFFQLKINDATKKLLEYFPNGERKAYEWMNRLGDWAKGEAAGIGITAIGTGLVAPWPIAYNPIVNHKLKKENASPEQIEEKHKTQKYSAWRQPVSAVLAVIFQLGIQKPIENVLKYMTNNPDTKFNGTVYNQAFLNDEKYLEKLVKKELRTKDKAAIKAEVARRTEEQVSEFAKALKGIKENDTQIKIGKHIVPTDAVAQALNNQIEDYINFARTLQKADNPKAVKNIDFYVGRAAELVENESILRQLLSPESLEANVNRVVNDNPKLDRPSAIRQYITEMRKIYEGKNPGMEHILDHILGKQDSVIESSCARNLERIDKVKKCCANEQGHSVFTSDKYRAYLKERNQLVEDRITALKELLTTKEEWKTAKPFDLKTKMSKIAEICHYNYRDSKLNNLFRDKGVFLADKDKLKNKILNDVIKKGYKEVVSNQYKIFSQITKASVATFIMLPITCTVLNWVYPRFMEIFFPKLAGIKKAQSQQNPQEQKIGGDK